MTDCADPQVFPAEVTNPPTLVPPPVGPTTLIERPMDERAVYTRRRDCDVVTAVKRGLREYLEQVYLDVLGVRVRFKRVVDVWAEPETTALFPSAAVMSGEQADYDTNSFTPSLDIIPLVPSLDDQQGRRTYLVKYSEVIVPLVVELYTNSPEERIQCSMLLEDALNPVDWMYGFKLQLPHYFNQIAVFEPMKTQMLDSEDNSRKRWRPGSVFLTARASVVRTRSLPGLQPLASIEVTDGSDGSEL